MPLSNYPDYFFPCPKCRHKILILVGEGHVEMTPLEALFSVECENCGWGGDLPFSEAAPLPV
jgi:DNA-directed RNA polymerase subunit RPC12/RpoP